jgi:hypothetical protein
VFGKKIFYVLKIDKTVRKTEINVDAHHEDPDIAELKKEEKVHSWIHYYLILFEEEKTIIKI